MTFGSIEMDRTPIPIIISVILVAPTICDLVSVSSCGTIISDTAINSERQMANVTPRLS